MIYGIKAENVYEDFSKDKEMFDLSNYQVKSKYYDNSNKLVVGKMKYEMGVAAIEEFVGLTPKKYFLLVDDSNKHRKTKFVNKTISRINYSE